MIKYDKPVLLITGEVAGREDPAQYPVKYRGVENFSFCMPPRYWTGWIPGAMIKNGEIIIDHSHLDVCYSGPPLPLEEYERQRRIADAWFNHRERRDIRHVPIST